jgi:polar amino acid transport system substrate-binding protein
MRWLVWLVMLVAVGCQTTTVERRAYRVGRDPAWYGLSLEGQEPAVTAFCDDLMLHMASMEGMRLELVTLGWNQLEQALESGMVDAILTAATPTPDQQQIWQFSKGYLAVGPVLVSRLDGRGGSLGDFNGKIVGVRWESPTAVVVGGLTSVIIAPYESMAVALHDVLWQKIDAAALSLLSATAYCRNLYNGQLHIATPPLTDDALRMAARRDSEMGALLLKDFEESLTHLRDVGIYGQLVSKWGLPQPPFDTAQGGHPCRAVAIQ